MKQLLAALLCNALPLSFPLQITNNGYKVTYDGDSQGDLESGAVRFVDLHVRALRLRECQISCLDFCGEFRNETGLSPK